MRLTDTALVFQVDHQAEHKTGQSGLVHLTQCADLVADRLQQLFAGGCRALRVQVDHGGTGFFQRSADASLEAVATDDFPTDPAVDLFHQG